MTGEKHILNNFIALNASEISQTDINDFNKVEIIDPLPTGQCFRDNAYRVLNGLIKKQNNFVTVDNCKEFCSVYQYNFAGVENSNQCFCGQNAPTQLLPDSECDKKCAGNDTEICGGKWAINVYPVLKTGN